jgi:hypothetical protein
MALALLVGASAPSYAHFPVTLSTAHSKAGTSPILLDGTISFAVYANFTKAKQERFVRFALKNGEELNLEYLIVDQSPTNRLKNSQLPTVIVTTPSGKKINLSIKERTPFFEPFGKKNYFYLSRTSQSGEAGIYTVRATAKTRASIVVAIGRTETRGDVLKTGTAKGDCPVTIANEETITESRGSQLMGMTEEAAEVCAAANAWLFRVGERDGEQFALTRDYRTNRVTVSVVSGTISSVAIG